MRNTHTFQKPIRKCAANLCILHHKWHYCNDTVFAAFGLCFQMAFDKFHKAMTNKSTTSLLQTLFVSTEKFVWLRAGHHCLWFQPRLLRTWPTPPRMRAFPASRLWEQGWPFWSVKENSKLEGWPVFSTFVDDDKIRNSVLNFWIHPAYWRLNWGGLYDVFLILLLLFNQSNVYAK